MSYYKLQPWEAIEFGANGCHIRTLLMEKGQVFEILGYFAINPERLN
jgi:hypothetical protein